MGKLLNCECGFTIRGETDDELVTSTQAHAREVHDMDLTRDQVLSLAESAD